MNAITIAGVVDEPGYSGLPQPTIHLKDGDAIAVAGIKDGMQSGKPSLALAFTLPDGNVVLVETSWRLWMTTTKYFEARFGDADFEGMHIEYSPTNDERRVDLEITDETPSYFQCELCGIRRDAADFVGTDEDRQLAMLQWVRRHFLEKHPEWTAPA